MFYKNQKQLEKENEKGAKKQKTRKFVSTCCGGKKCQKVSVKRAENASKNTGEILEWIYDMVIPLISTVLLKKG